MSATTDGIASNVLNFSGTAVALRSSKGGSNTPPSEKGSGNAKRSSSHGHDSLSAACVAIAVVQTGEVGI